MGRLLVMLLLVTVLVTMGARGASAQTTTYPHLKILNIVMYANSDPAPNNKTIHIEGSAFNNPQWQIGNIPMTSRSRY
jgi:hypothetical protein